MNPAALARAELHRQEGERTAPALATPSTRAQLLDLVEAWRSLDVIAVHGSPAPGRPPEYAIHRLAMAREHYRAGGWTDPAFARNPDLERAARLCGRASTAALKVRELLDLAGPGASWEPEGMAEAWTALHRVLREARPELPSLGKLP